MTNSATIPAPYGGIDEKIPKAALASPFCESLLNFNFTQAGISLRKGDSKFTNFAQAAAGTYPHLFAQYGNARLFVPSLNSTTLKIDIIDAETGATSFSSAANGDATFSELYFNNRLFLFALSGYAPGFVFDGTSWGLIGYTSALFFNPFGGNVFKNRAYLIQAGEPAYWYTGLFQVTGSLDPTLTNDAGKIDLSGVISENATLSIIAKVTVADTVETVALQAFVFSGGEVIFYSGSYPNSSDWGEVGRAKISPPLDYHSGLQYQGDYLVFCDAGVVSLRDLFLKGSKKATSLTVNSRIQKSWSALVKAARTFFAIPVGPITPSVQQNIAGVWDSASNRIIISFPFRYVSASTVTPGGFYFVFDTILQSWTSHRSYGSGEPYTDIAFFKNKVLTVTRGTTKVMIYQKEGSTGFTDRSANDTDDSSYDYSMLSAPIPFPKTAVHETTQIEPILESDLYAETQWNFVADFGRQTSGNQATSAGTTAVAKPAVNVGMQNITFVQVKMSGLTAASKTVGLDLYSYNVWYNAGEIGSR